MGLGRKGERVAKTPSRALPPSRGGRTVGDQVFRTAWENCQISQMWEKPSSPRSASGLRNSGSKTTRASSASTRPLCRGTPNLVGKSLRMRAMHFMSRSVMPLPPLCTAPIVAPYGPKGKDFLPVCSSLPDERGLRAERRPANGTGRRGGSRPVGGTVRSLALPAPAFPV